jgi:glycosyltransferase involved in cell wall biosynthesis
MADAMAASDVFLFPSLQDNCPLAVIESLACGTPVIAYEGSGGTPELLQAGENGLLARYNDEEGLSEKVRKILTDREAWAEKRLAISFSAMSRFAITRCASEHLAMYEQIAQN